MRVNKENIHKFYSIAQLSDGKHWIVDNAVNKNEIPNNVKANEDNYKVCVVDMDVAWCDWLEVNKGVIISYFKEKYNKK